MPELIIQSGRHQGKTLTLPEAGVIIGRDESCHIRLASSDVSRQHCSLTPSEDGLLVRDLGSRNGTLVNDMLIESETLLNPGDVLRIGPMVFKVPVAKPIAPRKQKVEVHTQPNARGDASEDDIATWLSTSDMGDAPIESNAEHFSPGDTTVIPRNALDEDTSPDAMAGKPGAKAGPRPSARRRFNTLAEEAADVIRRHWESVRESGGQVPPNK